MVDEQKCQECGTRYAASFGHDCPKKKKQGGGSAKVETLPGYYVKVTDKIAGREIEIGYRIAEKDKVAFEIRDVLLMFNAVEDLLKAVPEKKG